jgi:putative acetyltransferase
LVFFDEKLKTNRLLSHFHILKLSHFSKKMDIHLRRLSLPDLQFLQQLGRDTYAPYYPHVWYEGGLEWYLEQCFGDELLRRELTDPATEYWVASTEGQQTVGLLKIQPDQPVPENPLEPAFFIEKIYLMPDFFGKGVGQVILDMLARRATAMGRSAMWLNVMHNAGPVGAYAHAGFRITAPIRFEYDLLLEDERDGWRMVKPLEPAPQAEVIGFEPQYAADFKRLNVDWISRYFVVEPHDLEQLDDPQYHIIEPGGHILLACVGDQVAGTVAMVADGPTRFELAKMAVDDAFKGYGIGRKLGEAALAWARQRGATTVWLQSNRRLTPALQLYEHLGFREVPLSAGEYSRADIQMEVLLTLTPTFRRATVADLSALVAVSLDTFVETFAHLNDPADFEPYVAQAFDPQRIEQEVQDPSSIFYFVENEGVTLGYFKINLNRTPFDDPDALFQITPDAYRDVPMSELQRIYLYKKYHGLGIASPMLDEVESVARQHGSERLWLGVWDANAQARRFYAKRGFEEFGAHLFVLGSDPQTDILMWKTISLSD